MNFGYGHPESVADPTAYSWSHVSRIPTSFLSYQDAISNMQALIERLRKVSGPVLTLALFVVVFGLGFIVFALSGSVAISALCMALASTTSALATRELIGRPDEDVIRAVTQHETRQINRRISDISDRVMEIDAEIRHIISDRTTPERLRLDVMTRDIERISMILGDLALIVDANQARASLPRARPQDERRNDANTALITKPALPIDKSAPLLPTNALAALQMENMLREDILGGKMKVHLHDVMNIESNRVAFRKVECKLEGRLADFHSDSDLISARVSPGVIQLFDRMRFGFAYEFANQFGLQAGSAPILCPLMDATFGNPVSADEIVATIEGHKDLSRQLVLALDHSVLSRPTPAEEQRLKRLQLAGSSIATILSNDASPDPELLYQRGVRFVLAQANFLLGRENQRGRSAIHPSDLASYLARHDISVIAQSVNTPSDLKNLKSIGVAYATGSIFSHKQQGNSSDSMNTDKSLFPHTSNPVPVPALTDHTRPSALNIAPLRDRLRRIRT